MPYQFTILILFDLTKMKVKPYKQEVIELVLQFLAGQLGEKQLAEELRAKHIKHIPENILQNNLLIKKGLTKVIKTYVQLDKNIKQYYMKRVVQKPKSSDEQEQEQKPKKVEVKKPRKVSNHSQQQDDKIVNKPKPKLTTPAQQKTDSYHASTSTWVKNKFQPPKKLQQIGKEQPVKVVKPIKHPSMVAKEASSEESSDRPLHSDDSESEQKIKKSVRKQIQPAKIQKKKKKAKETSSQQSSQESSVQKKAPIKQKKVVKQLKKIQKQVQKQVQKPEKTKNSKPQKQEQPTRMRTRSQDQKQQNLQQNNKSNGTKKAPATAFSSFTRIKLDQVGPIPQMLKDNSFEAKFKYGKGGDDWGKYGHQRLKDTRGESFKKTKDKLKNKVYQGGKIDFNIINSISLE